MSNTLVGNMAFQMEMALVCWIGVLLLVYGCQLVYKWVQDDKSKTPNMMIVSMMGAIGYKQSPSDPIFRYIKDPSVTLCADVALFWSFIGVMLIPPVIHFWWVTLFAMCCAVLVYGARFVTRLSKQLTSLQHDRADN